MFKFSDFIILSDYLVEKIIYLQLKVDDTQKKWFEIKTKSEDVKSLISQNHHLYEKYYAESALDVIEFMLEKINVLRNDIINIKTFSDFN